jgi:uncharacterized protein
MEIHAAALAVGKTAILEDSWKRRKKYLHSLAVDAGKPETSPMGLIRLLILGAVIAIIYSMVKRWLNAPGKTEEKISHQGEMVRCAYCGTFVPEQDAVRAGNKTYCSRAHAEADHHS